MSAPGAGWTRSPAPLLSFRKQALLGLGWGADRPFQARAGTAGSLPALPGVTNTCWASSQGLAVTSVGYPKLGVIP